MKHQQLLVANWKMNGSAELVDSISATLAGITFTGLDVVICPPFTLLHRFAEQRNFALGAQNVSQHSAGAYTGEISAAQLLEANATYVIIGHSERRTLNAETDELIAAKLKAATEAGLTPILCVGETLEQRQQEKTEQVIARQLDAVYASQPELLAKSVIAYEPIWAIGTGESASPEQAQAIHAFIRDHLAQLDSAVASKIKLLYGGSVNGENCSALFAQPDINGALVGGASLKAAEFAQICSSAQE
ncbi:triose-phosphate isomerase [Rheinheimera sp. WS51]|uniref:triose-phosphate isomerase n=1 Tax=Rheinheimera sp. WS51 TaxID=3425886 RepID=UPI003D920C20